MKQTNPYLNIQSPGMFAVIGRMLQMPNLPLFLIAIFSGAAAIMSAWITSRTRSYLPGCGVGSGCDVVTRSRWSRWMGRVPVTALALTDYLLICVGSIVLLATRSEAFLRLPLLLVCLMAGGGAIWFALLQWIVIRRFCIYCTCLHVLSLAICGLAIYLVYPLSHTEFTLSATSSACAVGVLILGQFIVTPKTFAVSEQPVHAIPTAAPTQLVSPSPRAFDRSISVLEGKANLAVGEWPMIGAADAPNVLICLFDFTCSTCRQTHELLIRAVDHFDGRLAVMLLPVPMDPCCNRSLTQRHATHAYACQFARLALTVWQSDNSRYAEFDRSVFAGDEVPPIGFARAKAQELLGDPDIDPSRPDRRTDDLIFRAIDVYTTAGTESIPTLLFPHAKVSGQLPSVEKLIEIVLRQFPTLIPPIAQLD